MSAEIKRQKNGRRAAEIETDTDIKRERRISEVDGPLKLVLPAWNPSRPLLSNVEAIGYTWPLSAWNVASVNWEVSVYVKCMLDFKDLEKRM